MDCSELFFSYQIHLQSQFHEQEIHSITSIFFVLFVAESLQVHRFNLIFSETYSQTPHIRVEFLCVEVARIIEDILLYYGRITCLSTSLMLPECQSSITRIR